MSPDVLEARERLDATVARVDKANEAIQALDKTATETQITDLEYEFYEAERAFQKARDDCDRAESVYTARQIITPVGYDGLTPSPPAVEGEPQTMSTIRARVTSEPRTYDPHNGESFFRDLLDVRKGSRAASDRLARHEREMQVEERVMSSADADSFIPPVHLQSEWASFARPSRPFADALPNRELPPTGDTLTLPRVTGGSEVAAHTENSPVASQDLTTDQIEIPVKVLAGQIDMSLMSMQRSDPGLDTVIAEDLAEEYALQLNRQVLSGSGSGPNSRGVLNTANIGVVTYTDADPDVPTFYAKLAECVNAVHTNRFRSPTLVAVHPRRWAWLLASTDTTGRPLVPIHSPSNALARFDRVAPEALVADIQGIGLLVDPSIPTDQGYDSDQDTVIVTRTNDHLFFENRVPRIRVFEEVLSGNLQVRIQAYAYHAYSAAKYPAATCVMVGTGLKSPF